MNPHNLRILITGASSGLGAGLSKAFATEGATLGLLGRNEDRLSKVALGVKELGARSWTRPVDVTDTRSMAMAVADFAEAAGGLDVVIANAGVGEGTGPQRFDPDAVAEVVRVNTIGLTNTLLPAIPILRSCGRGTLVGMASLAGYGALPGSLAYSATKSFVITFMRGLAIELHESGIHSVVLCPGFIRTPLTDKNAFRMPLLLECEDACQRMKRAILANESHYAFPSVTSWGARALSKLPARLVRALVRSESEKG